MVCRMASEHAWVTTYCVQLAAFAVRNSMRDDGLYVPGLHLDLPSKWHHAHQDVQGSGALVLPRACTKLAGRVLRQCFWCAHYSKVIFSSAAVRQVRPERRTGSLRLPTSLASLAVPSGCSVLSKSDRCNVTAGEPLAVSKKGSGASVRPSAL
jgi:hypothetical protein